MPPILLAPNRDVCAPAPNIIANIIVLHPKFPRFYLFFSDSYLIFPTATEFSRQLPHDRNFPTAWRQVPFFFSEKLFFSDFFDIFLHSYMRLPPNRCVLFRYIPSLFPNLHPPISPPYTPIPPPTPSCPPVPVERSFPPLAACTKRPSFTFTDTITEICRQLPNLADRSTGNCRQLPYSAYSYRISTTNFRRAIQVSDILVSVNDINSA